MRLTITTNEVTLTLDIDNDGNVAVIPKAKKSKRKVLPKITKEQLELACEKVKAGETLFQAFRDLGIGEHRANAFYKHEMVKAAKKERNETFVAGPVDWNRYAGGFSVDNGASK